MMYVTGYGNTYWSYWWVHCTLVYLVRVHARAPNQGKALEWLQLSPFPTSR